MSGRRLVVLTVLVLLVVPTVAIAQSRSSDDVQHDLDAARGQADRLGDELDELQDQLSAAEEELAELGARLADARGRLANAESQVALAEDALLDAQDLHAAAVEDHERAEDLLARTERRLAEEEAVLVDQVVEGFKYGTAGASRGAMTIEILRRAEDPNAFAVGLKQLKVVVDTQESTVQRVFDLREERTELAEAAERARGRAAQAAADAAETLGVVEELREQAAELERQIAADEERQRQIVASLRADAAETEALLERVAAREAELRKEYDRRRAEEIAAAAAAASSGGGGPGVEGGVCPVVGARAGRDFINDWGFPRSGGRSHQGNDIFAAKGTPVVAIQAGKVVRINPPSRPTRLGGITVTYRTADGSEWYNAHLDTIAGGISVGASVEKGQQIGTVGNSGNAKTTPPHLHIGRRHGGSWVNPWPAVSKLC